MQSYYYYYSYYYSPSSYYYYYYYDYSSYNSTYYVDLGSVAKIAGGAIAGIIIGSIVCFAFTLFLILFCFCTRKVVINGQMVREWKCCPKTKIPTVDPNYNNQPQQTTQMMVQQPAMMIA